jgi:hypothetical protein
MDLKQKTVTFFTDEELMIVPYLIQVGNKPRSLKFAREVMDKFVRHVLGTKRTKKFGIFTLDNKLQVSVIKKSQLEFEMKYRIACPLLSVFLNSEDDKVEVWTRKGAALTRSGEVHNQGVVTVEGEYDEWEKSEKGSEGAKKGSGVIPLAAGMSGR